MDKSNSQTQRTSMGFLDNNHHKINYKLMQTSSIFKMMSMYLIMTCQRIFVRINMASRLIMKVALSSRMMARYNIRAITPRSNKYLKMITSKRSKRSTSNVSCKSSLIMMPMVMEMLEMMMQIMMAMAAVMAAMASMATKIQRMATKIQRVMAMMIMIHHHLMMMIS